MTVQKILLDTDIGDDVDDALALALICACPELELCGVTTVFGNVAARSRQARTMLQTAGKRFARIPVAAGCGATLASRPMPGRGTSQYLENVLPIQAPVSLPETELPPPEPRDGARFLVDTLLAGDGDIVPVAIGALTNLAVALTLDRRIAACIPRLAVMAGEFKRGMAEWNIRCDPEAAAIVFGSGLPIDLVPYSAGIDASFEPRHLARLSQGEGPLQRLLGRAIGCWQRDDNAMPALFDPLAIVGLLRPELLQWRRGSVRVELQGNATYGFTTFEAQSDGPHRVVWEVDRDAVLDFYLERVTAFTSD